MTLAGCAAAPKPDPAFAPLSPAAIPRPAPATDGAIYREGGGGLSLFGDRRAYYPGDLITITLSAADPLNLMGIVVPGPRIPALHTNAVSFRDGVPEAAPAHPRAAVEVRLPAAV